MAMRLVGSIGKFPGPGKPVVVECGLAEIVVHRFLGGVGLKGRTCWADGALAT